jgi:hypothetical protein
MSVSFEELVKKVNERFSAVQQYEKAISDKLYSDLNQNIKSASVAEKAIEEGIDTFFDPNRIKIASLDDLFAFDRIGNNTLVHKAQKDLWAIESDDDGVHISRLFDNSGEPLKV